MEDRETEIADHDCQTRPKRRGGKGHECVRGALKEDQHKTNTLNV